MNTYPSASRCRSTRPERVSALLACLLIVALLLPGGAGWTAQAAPPAQEAQPDRLPYDGLFDLPRQQSAAPQRATGPALTGPEYVDWSRLVFQSARNNNDWEIYAARGDGANQVNISNHGSMDIHPRLNRGATRVVFASNRHGGYDLFTMNADGGGQNRLIDHPGDDVFPAWSPDGSRIAFQSYRDSQPQIYAVNADGSGLARLTYHGDYDGQPAWSPDGRQIAFVRRESGGYRIWAMNADGSNQRQLSSQPYSADPAWSPDGSQIAYDADGNGDGWQEIWLMNADGSNQRQVYDPPEGNTDAWVGSWSPDGRYVAFTRISFVLYQGQWYWTSAYLDAWDSTQPWNTIRLSGNGADWNPAWASTDDQAPGSRVLPLPAQSPATFTVYWTGDDTGGSGLKNFDVQIREGAGGTWTDWQAGVTATSASYTGVGGRAYYFRARGRDNAGNVEAWPASHDAMTTVEPNPPQTAVEALPAYSRNGLLVRWGGSDPGGSGIQSFDVQVRQGSSGAWTDWRIGVAEASATFTGTAGAEYRFRSRASDRAQNLEAWPARADAITTLYTWGVTGKATDNRGAPVEGMATWTAPPAFHMSPSDDAGAYSAHVSPEAATHTVSWGKAGYGPLPSTAFPPDPDASVDVVLPPADNVVQNWGFESGGGGWQFGGNLPALIANDRPHTGASAAFLGSAAPAPTSVATIATPVGIGVSSAIDGSDTIHAAWVGSDRRPMVSSKAPAAAWSTPVPLPGPLGYLNGTPVLQVDGAGTVHAVWIAENEQLHYSRKRPGGGWSTPEVVPGSQSGRLGYRLAVNSSGVVKVVWSDIQYTAAYFTARSPEGVWTPTRNISAPYSAGLGIWLALDPAGLAHVLWLATDANNHRNAFYTAELGNGDWLPPENLSACSHDANDADMAIDSRGGIHVVWSCPEVTYRMRPPGASWSASELIEAPGSWVVSLAVDRLDRLHLVWYSTWQSSEVRYAMRSDAAWSSPVAVAPPPTPSQANVDPVVTVDKTLTVHVLWKEEVGFLRYAAKRAQGNWTAPVTVHQTSGGSNILKWQLHTDRSGTPHVTWRSTVGSNPAVLYAGPMPIQSAGSASMAQLVPVPAAALAPTLSFMYDFASSFPSASRLEATVDDGVSPTVVFSDTTTTDTWTHAWVDLTPWAGRSVTLRFKLVEEAGGAQAWAYIDEVTVGSAHPDIWVSQPAWQAALPGRTFETTLTYGNRGGVAASGGQVTLQLPAQLNFVGADPPPSATTPTLRWDVGALPAQSGPQTIRVTLQVAASAAGGSTVTTTAGITSSTTELEQANNTAQGSVFIGSVRYMPVIMR